MQHAQGQLRPHVLGDHIDLQWENICFNIGAKAILDGLSGKVSSGEMLAGTPAQSRHQVCVQRR